MMLGCPASIVFLTPLGFGRGVATSFQSTSALTSFAPNSSSSNQDATPWSPTWLSSIGKKAGERFSIELSIAGDSRVFRYPDDPYLPALKAAADPVAAHALIARDLGLHPQKLKVRRVVYRAGSRAVLRYTLGQRRDRDAPVLYARVIPPAQVEPLIAAGHLAAKSSFILPRVHFISDEGIVWFSGIPGKRIRDHIRQGDAPPPDDVLDCLASLWSPIEPETRGTGSLPEAYEWYERRLADALGPALGFDDLIGHLREFAASWRPTSIAHNDFYDAQVIVDPGRRLALVDFEETGPGDPLLDVANFLAHLRWMTWFGKPGHACAPYHAGLRERSLERFDWAPGELAVREAYALFRLATNPLRQMEENWRERTLQALRLAGAALRAEPPTGPSPSD
jgi:Phosphotransferase enzyme family